MMNKLNDKYIKTFTKTWVSRLLWFGVIWITWSYVLATLGKTDIAESLSQTVAQVVIATLLGYLCKAFFETFSEKHNILKEKELNHNYIFDDDTSESDEME